MGSAPRDVQILGVVPKWGRISGCSVSGASEMMGWRWENLNRSQPADGRRSVLGDVMCHRQNQTSKSISCCLTTPHLKAGNSCSQASEVCKAWCPVNMVLCAS